MTRSGDAPRARWAAAASRPTRSAAREVIRAGGENGPPECYGTEAAAFTRSLLPVATEVRLERDVVGRDHYGRLLAHVYRLADGLLVNQAILEHGLRATAHDRTQPRLRRPLRGRHCRRRSRWAGAVERVRRIASAPWAPSPPRADRWSNDSATRRDAGRDHLLRRSRVLATPPTSASTAPCARGVATCASLMVPAPWARHAAEMYERRRRHRRSPDAQRRAPHLPLGTDHPRALAAVRRGRLPSHDRRPVGARRPRRGAS